MNLTKLKEALAKKEERVEKTKKTIERHYTMLNKKMDNLKKKGLNVKDPADLEEYKYGEDNRGSEFYWDIVEVERKVEDIERAEKKLKDEERKAKEAREKLETVQKKENNLAQQDVPKEILDFLDRWEDLAYQWHVKRHEDYQGYKKRLRKRVEEATIRIIEDNPSHFKKYLDEDGNLLEKYSSSKELREVHPQSIVENGLREKGLDSMSRGELRQSYAGLVVLAMDKINDEEKRLAFLKDTLKKDKKEKLDVLISKINAEVGRILSGEKLTISDEGTINGVITGEKGRVKVNTFMAGGWAVQCFHFRTRVTMID